MDRSFETASKSSVSKKDYIPLRMLIGDREQRKKQDTFAQDTSDHSASKKDYISLLEDAKKVVERRGIVSNLDDNHQRSIAGDLMIGIKKYLSESGKIREELKELSPKLFDDAFKSLKTSYDFIKAYCEAKEKVLSDTEIQEMPLAELDKEDKKLNDVLEKLNTVNKRFPQDKSYIEAINTDILDINSTMRYLNAIDKIEDISLKGNFVSKKEKMEKEFKKSGELVAYLGSEKVSNTMEESIKEKLIKSSEKVKRMIEEKEIEVSRYIPEVNKEFLDIANHFRRFNADYFSDISLKVRDTLMEEFKKTGSSNKSSILKDGDYQYIARQMKKEIEDIQVSKDLLEKFSGRLNNYLTNLGERRSEMKIVAQYSANASLKSQASEVNDGIEILANTIQKTEGIRQARESSFIQLHKEVSAAISTPPPNYSEFSKSGSHQNESK